METNKGNRDSLISRLIRSIQESEETLPEHDIDLQWKRFVALREKEKRSAMRRKWYVRCSVAASFLLLLAGWLGWHLAVTDSGKDCMDIALLDDRTWSGDGKNLVLMDGNHIINLKDSANLRYYEDGTDNIDSCRIRQPGIVRPVSADVADDRLNRMIVPVGKRATLTLSEGTKIYLNSNTKLVYPKQFDPEKREILLDGEGYLAVSRHEEWPFIVKTRSFDVQVLGTEFDVQTVDGKGCSSVVLVNGCVEIKASDEKRFLLKPDQRAVMKGEELSIEEVDVLEYVSWKDNALYLKGWAAGRVFDYIEQNYGYQIVCSHEIASSVVTGKLDLQNDIHDMLKAICLLLGADYSMNNNVIYIKTEVGPNN